MGVSPGELGVVDEDAEGKADGEDDRDTEAVDEGAERAAALSLAMSPRPRPRPRRGLGCRPRRRGLGTGKDAGVG